MTDLPADLDDTVLRRRDVVGGDRSDVEDTVLRGRRAPDADDTVVPPRRLPVADADVEDTVVRPRAAPLAPRADEDDDTVLVGRRAVLAGGAPGAGRPPVAPAPPAADRRRHSIRVGGVVHLLDAPVVLGRRPAAPRVARGPVPRLVPVPSPSGQVSSSHVDVRHEGEVVVVTDLRSTNGTRVAQPGRPVVALRQGESMVVLAGSTVDLGDGVVVEVLPPQRLTLEDGPRP